jgi:hypothetical protein
MSIVSWLGMDGQPFQRRPLFYASQEILFPRHSWEANLLLPPIRSLENIVERNSTATLVPSFRELVSSIDPNSRQNNSNYKREKRKREGYQLEEEQTLTLPTSSSTKEEKRVDTTELERCMKLSRLFLKEQSNLTEPQEDEFLFEILEHPSKRQRKSFPSEPRQVITTCYEGGITAILTIT